MSEIWVQGGDKMCPGQVLYYVILLQLFALHFKTLFKFTAHSLPPKTLWAKCEPNWANGKNKIMFGQGIQEGRIDGQQTIWSVRCSLKSGTSKHF